ncbi:hypothetical protein LT493_24510 [Streptomyces tricolor]|nr:hypothetical protein [Streptomyces tricolor]
MISAGSERRPAHSLPLREERAAQQVAGKGAVRVHDLLLGGAHQPDLELVVLSHPVTQVRPVAEKGRRG